MIRSACFSLGLMLTVACGDTEPEAPDPAVPAVTDIRVGYIPIADCAHLYAATDQKIWEKHNLRVEQTAMAGGAKILEALAADAVDLAFTNVVSLTVARSRGLPFMSVGGAVIEDAAHAPHRLLIRADLPFKGPADLKGMRIAVNTLRNIDQMVMGEYLGTGGLTLDDVTLREVPFPRMQGVLASGELDAASGIEPFVTVSIADGRVLGPVNPFTEMAARTLVATYVMKDAVAKSATGQAVRAALADASAWIATHDAETRALVAANTRLDAELTRDLPMSLLEAAPSAEDFALMIDRAQAAGLLGDKKPTPSELMLP